MTYSDRLTEVSSHEKSIVCMGADPDPTKMPIKNKFKFYKEILDAVKASGEGLGAVKPNYAFFAQDGFSGLRDLYKLISYAKSLGYPLILDAKRADIGKTSQAYAKEVFDFWGADAVTLHPYMGFDSVMPFIERAEQSNGGVYILTRTSNKGAKDFQDVKTEDSKPFFMVVAEKDSEWGKDHDGTVGAVTGATYIDELERISDFFVKSGVRIPLLIPGVGAQGGHARECTERLIKTRNPVGIHRINSSGALNYAYKDLGMKPTDFAEASVIALSKMNEEISETLKKYEIEL